MKAAFVIPGLAKYPDGAKMAANGITRLYYQADDKQISAGFFDELRKLHIEVGLMYDPSWHNSPSPQTVAETMDADVKATGSDAKQCAVMFDIEGHDPWYVLDVLKQWRLLRPTRPTIWTLEPEQGGWFTPELVAQINGDVNLLVVPQHYLGNPSMKPVAADSNVRDLIVRGVKPERVRGFYGLRDENHKLLPLPAYWDGVAYVESWAQLAVAA